MCLVHIFFKSSHFKSQLDRAIEWSKAKFLFFNFLTRILGYKEQNIAFVFYNPFIRAVTANIEDLRELKRSIISYSLLQEYVNLKTQQTVIQ